MDDNKEALRKMLDDGKVRLAYSGVVNTDRKLKPLMAWYRKVSDYEICLYTEYMMGLSRNYINN